MYYSFVTFYFGFLSVITLSKTKPNLRLENFGWPFNEGQNDKKTSIGMMKGGCDRLKGVAA